MRCLGIYGRERLNYIVNNGDTASEQYNLTAPGLILCGFQDNYGNCVCSVDINFVFYLENSVF